MIWDRLNALAQAVEEHEPTFRIEKVDSTSAKGEPIKWSVAICNGSIGVVESAGGLTVEGAAKNLETRLVNRAKAMLERTRDASRRVESLLTDTSSISQEKP